MRWEVRPRLVQVVVLCFDRKERGFSCQLLFKYNKNWRRNSSQPLAEDPRIPEDSCKSSFQACMGILDTILNFLFKLPFPLCSHAPGSFRKWSLILFDLNLF